MTLIRVYMAYVLLVLSGFVAAWYYGYSIADGLFGEEVEREYGPSSQHFHK